MSLQRRSRQVPCADCIERASIAYANANRTPPGLCRMCRVTLTRTEMPKSWKQPPADRSRVAEPGNVARNEDTSHLHHVLARPTLAVEQQAQTTTKGPTPKSLASLTHLTRRFVSVVNDRDFVSPIWYKASAGIEVDALDNFTPTTTLAENIQTFQTITKESPQYRLHVVSIDVLESQDGDMAESYINMRVTGRPPGLVMNSVGRMQWRRCEDDWVLISFTAMRFSDLS